MRVVHDPDGRRRSLATEVDTADTLLARTVGLMGRSSLPEEYALVFRFDGVTRRAVHMLFVRVPLDVVWLRDGEVVEMKTLSPWTGFGRAKCDTILELPAGAAAGVSVGDSLTVETDESAA